MKRDYRIIRKLVGHSGCDILLLENNSGNFVRKISSSKIYNDRLKLQLKKQMSTSLVFKSPQIYDSGYDVDLFYFDMEYINGMTLNHLIKETYEKKDLDFVISIFIKYVESFEYKKKDCKSESFKDAVNLKLEQILLSDGSKEFKNEIKTLNEYHWPNLQESACHGDLSLENILVLNGEVFLIDYLDSFFDSYLIDLSKFFMDLTINWSNRKASEQPDLVIKYIYLRDKVLELIKEKELIINLSVLHLLRIIPYVKGLDNLKYLRGAMDRLLNLKHRII